MKNFDWNEFKNEKVAVHCDTYEKAEDFENKYRFELFKSSEKLNIYRNDINLLYSCDFEIVNNNIEKCIKQGFKIIEWEIEDDTNKLETPYKKVLDSQYKEEIDKLKNINKKLEDTGTYDEKIKELIRQKDLHIQELENKNGTKGKIIGKLQDRITELIEQNKPCCKSEITLDYKQIYQEVSEENKNLKQIIKLLSGMIGE